MGLSAKLAAALTAKRTTRSASPNDPEPVDDTTPAAAPPPRPASEMNHAQLAKADHSTPGLLDALDAALGSLGVVKPKKRAVRDYQSALKTALHAKTQKGKTFKTRVDGAILWDAAAHAALLEAVPELSLIHI